MSVQWKKAVLVISGLVVCFSMVGCGGGEKPKELAPKIDLGTTIGLVAEVFSFDAIGVEGYALVGGLRGTGSAQCPPQVREYLKKYILKQFSDRKVDAGKFINSKNTAVVVVRGIMPAAVSKNQYFDVSVAALAGTQTTSLEGGELLGADLKQAGRFGISTRVLATAEGAVFIDTISTARPDKKTGYVLGGGLVLDEYKINLALREPDYRIASLIRNRLNERFGDETAKAVSRGRIELKVPAKYKEQKQRFISLVKATYFSQTPETTRERIKTLVKKLAVSEDKEPSEIALEATGNESLSMLAALLNSSTEEVRLRAARCMLNLESDEGLVALREIAMDKNSSYRIEALEAITIAASRDDAAAISRILLRDDDFEIRLAGYETLRKLDDIAVTRRLIGHNFYLEQIIQSKDKAIFVSRSGQPRIALFGAQVFCRENIFVQSPDGNITINAPAGQKYVSIIRKHPRRRISITLESSFELSDIIQTLCESAIVEDDSGLQPGLGVSYADAIALLKQMCEKGAVEAEFRAGPLPKIGL